jgi:hypothetical protein
MPIIYCDINIFDYDQGIYLLEDGKSKLLARVPAGEIGRAIPDICYDKDVYNVHISCNIPGMAKQAAEAIYRQEELRYNVIHKIDVEIN